MRRGQYKYNYIDAYLHTYIFTFTQPHENKLKYFPLKKAKQNWVVTPTKWQSGCMRGAPTERIDMLIKHVVKKVVKKVF